MFIRSKQISLFLLLAIIWVNIGTGSGRAETSVSKLNSTKSYGGGALLQLVVPSPEDDVPQRNVLEWVPSQGGDDPRVLPVVYFLHGWPGSPSGMVTAIVPELIKLFQAGTKPFIAVFPDGNAQTHIDPEWADTSDSKAMIETWLTTNVINAVEGKRIRKNTERALVGFSMGGYGAAIISLHHPELYTQVVSIAGYFIVDDLTGAFASLEKIKYQTPSNFMTSAKKLRWFLAEASDDYTVPIRGQAAQWAIKLTKARASFKKNSQTGGHSFNFVTKELAPITKWFNWPARIVLPTPTSSP